MIQMHPFRRKRLHRFRAMGVLLGTGLLLAPTLVGAEQFSGKVTDLNGNVLVGACVSLSASDTMTQTDSTGSWKLGSKLVGVMARSRSFQNAITNHLVMDKGRLGVQFNGIDGLGRSVGDQTTVPASRITAQLPATRALADVAPDSLEFSWRGRVRVRVLASAFLAGSIQKIDTNWTAVVLACSSHSCSTCPNPGNVLPPEGESMTSNWTTKPYLFGPWFTYQFHNGTAVHPLTPLEDFATTDGKMCITLTGTAIAAGGGAIGFSVCAGPTYPDKDGLYKWFPFNCTDNPAATCIPSEGAMPISYCGSQIVGVRFVGTNVQKIEWKGPNDSNIGVGGGHAEVVPFKGYAAAPKGEEGNITAIHFKSFKDVEMCLSSVEFVYK